MNTGHLSIGDGLLLQPKQKTTKENLDKWWLEKESDIGTIGVILYMSSWD